MISDTDLEWMRDDEIIAEIEKLIESARALNKQINDLKANRLEIYKQFHKLGRKLPYDYSSEHLNWPREDEPC